MEKTIIKETRIIISWSEIESIVFDYLKSKYKIEIHATPDDIELRVLIGEARTPAKPKDIKISYKELY